MERNEVIAKLKELLKEVQEFNAAKAALEQVEAQVYKLKYSPDSKLAVFDETHKDSFLKEKIGDKPVQPPEIWKLLFPVYLIQKAIYDGAIANYNKLLPDAESAYLEHFEKERNELQAIDAIEQTAALKSAELILANAKERFSVAYQQLNANDLFGKELKSEDAVQEILGYFTNRRVDTIKEAVNLWFDEQRKNEEEKRAALYREEMIALEEERVRAAQSAEEYAELQYYEAQEATRYAKRAADSAEEAAERTQYYQYSNTDDDN